MIPQHPTQERRWLWSPSGLVLLAFLAIAAFFLMLARRSAPQSPTPAQQRAHWWRLYLAGGGLAGALRGAAYPHHSDHRSLRAPPPSTVRRVYPDPVWVFVAMADA